MKSGKKQDAILTLLILIFTIGILTGLISCGIYLYLSGTAAVAAGTAEAVFTRRAVCNLLQYFVLPTLILFGLLITAAVRNIKPYRPKRFADRQWITKLQKGKRICVRRKLSAKIYLPLYLTSVILIAAGVWNGGLRDVLIKAINICTECIGLG